MKLPIMRLWLTLLTLFLATTLLGQSNAPEAESIASISAIDAIDSIGDVELASLVARVRERANRYYVDLQKVAWIETVRQQVLNADRTPGNEARELVYDTTVRLQAPAEGDNSMPFYIRDMSELRFVDGRPVRQNDRPDTTDPQPAAGLMSFLLARDWRLSSYSFSYGGREDVEGRDAFVIDVTFPRSSWISVEPFDRVSLGPAGDAPRIVWRGNAFAAGGLETKGRIWVDAENDDVLRFERRTTPVEFTTPDGRDRLRFETVLTVRFQSLTFDNAEETILAPQSVEYLHITEGGRIPVRRSTHSFTEYRKFSGDVTIIPVDDGP